MWLVWSIFVFQDYIIAAVFLAIQATDLAAVTLAINSG